MLNDLNPIHFLNSQTVTITLLGIVTLVPSIVVFAYADNSNPGVYSVDSKPFGITYPDWTASWEQWLISQTDQANAAADTTGKFCAINQNGPVWFLAGTTGQGPVVRTCTVPHGKAILFPVVNSECSYIDNPTARSESDLIMCAKQDNNRATSLQASVDGHSLQQLDKYRVTSRLVPVTFPNGNMFGVTPGRTQIVVDGFYVFLQPLAQGDHTLRFSSFTPPASPGGANYVVDVMYHLKIQ
jgi:hypothetical protein